MPRLPVDGVKVQELRITLGGKEREILESASAAYSMNRISTPIVNLISDQSAMVLIGAMVAFFLPNWLPEGWEEVTEGKSYAWVKDWLETQNLAGAFAGGVGGAAVGGPVGGLFGALLGLLGVEVAEDIHAEVSQAVDITSTAGVIVLSHVIREMQDAAQEFPLFR